MSSSSLEKEMFRVKTSFTHQKDKLLSRVRDCNDKIITFLQQASHLSGAKLAAPSKPARKQTTKFLTLQGDALALYETFQTQLSCKCTSNHSCGITVSGKGNLKDEVTAVHLKIFFWDGPCRTQVKILSIPAPDSKTKTSPGPSTGTLEEVSSLRQKWSARNRLETVRKGSPKTLFALAVSSIPTFGRLPLAKPRKELPKPQEQSKRSPRVRWTSSLSKR